ncbi:helix-turn-helix transcriptional regulator [Microvirga thermotolerans]|uniref:Helix-turn-helix domain-containing protein n=1 Tax=Microvirga thermotolerans TaxID=2651334 RepID=A0A5P9JRY6_9HYPH|nr:AraC family transcriptional regulator [Microvirga thermotolerans]QFU15377.1 helix-turn-helix domain-containing protein [Microvirga thermotolerans]
MSSPPEDETEPGPQDGLIIDRTWRSPKLEELENALNTLVSPQRLVPTSRDTSGGGMFGYRGQVDLGIFRVRVESDVEIDQIPEDADDRMAFVLGRGEASQLRIEGESFPISQERAVIFPSGPRRILTIPRHAEHHVLIVNRRKIAECCARLLGEEIPGFVDFDVGVDLDTASGSTWRRLMNFAETDLSDPNSLIRRFPLAWRQFEQSLLTGLLLSQRHAYSEALLAPRSAAIPFYVRRAEAFIEAHFAEPLSLADIAAHAGVSARSLQNGFQSFRGMTPMAFLRSIRLQQAHRRLRLADPAHETVTEIALACGFGHMGEFGTLYKRTFGVTPRETLLKKA